MKNFFWVKFLLVAMITLSSASTFADRDQLALKGPTINLDYGLNITEPNPVESFMYFVPLTSKTPVANWFSKINDQTAKVISYSKKTKKDSFTVECQFAMNGEGVYKNVFNTKKIIETNVKRAKGKGTLKQIPEYISFEGEAVGCIEIKGTIKKGVETVQEVKVSFNKSGKSPVLISMYDVKPKNGKYLYSNRSNNILARVNKLTFKRDSKNPKMDVGIASIRPSKSKEGLIASISGVVATAFLPPMSISQQGSDSMMNFGETLVRKQMAFSFPRAESLEIMVAMSNSK